MTGGRILLCSQAAHVGGGGEAWLTQLTSALAAHGWDVHLALATGRCHDPERYLARHPHENVHHIADARGLREGRLFALLAVFERVKPQIVLPVHLIDALYAAAYWKARGALARLAVCVHAQTEGSVEDARVCASFVDLAASGSKRVVGLLQSRVGLDDDRVVHIPVGAPPPLVPPKPRQSLRHIGYVGRLDANEKRVLDAVDLVRRLRGTGIVCHFFGNGPAEPELRAAFESDMAAGSVILHGAMPRERLYREGYPCLDALLVFSVAETGPMALWEAMSHGVVPIVSDYVGRAEEGVVRDGETGIVFALGDVERAAAAVLSLRDSAELARLSRNACETLPAAYRAEEFGRRWHQALADCLERPAQRGSDGVLPRQVSPGWIARLGIGELGTWRLRSLLGRRHVHGEAGSEWPHTYFPSAEGP